MAWANGGQTRTSTAEHRSFRRAVLVRDGHTCQGCGYHDPTGRALEADHIVNFKAGGATDPRNGQTLCIPCHKAKTAREAGQARRGRRRRPPERHPGLI